MKVRCPNCPAVIIEFTQLLDSGQVETMRCGKCGMYLTHFWDEFGVTYCAHSLSKIQEMRDETKEARTRLNSLSKRSNRTSRKWKSVATPETDSGIKANNDPAIGTNQ